MRPLNIYTLSRVSDERLFNIAHGHESGLTESARHGRHEIASLRALVDALVRCGLTASAMDGFYFGYSIPQIGKEFDLLRITDTFCLNIELKSQAVPEEQIRRQLLRNRHYLSHLGRRLGLYAVVTDTLRCYKLTVNEELEAVTAEALAAVLRREEGGGDTDISRLFRASDYLVSPYYRPERFIQGEYFLTQAQDQVKRHILQAAEALAEDDDGTASVLHLTGKPGTGKTLLLYDLGKTLARFGRTLIIHGWKMSPGLEKIDRELDNLSVMPAEAAAEPGCDLAVFNSILVDEAQRLEDELADRLAAAASCRGRLCLFSTDPDQILSPAEAARGMTARVSALAAGREYLLSEKIRANRELSGFIDAMKNPARRRRPGETFASVSVCWAGTTQEAQDILTYYRDRGYVFIHYSRRGYPAEVFAPYEEDFDTHQVIGQEFDDVVMLMDSTFYYDDNGLLQGIPHPDLLYPNLFYQGITRVREHLALIIVRAPALFETVMGILETPE